MNVIVHNGAYGRDWEFEITNDDGTPFDYSAVDSATLQIFAHNDTNLMNSIVTTNLFVGASKLVWNIAQNQVPDRGSYVGVIQYDNTGVSVSKTLPFTILVK